MPLSYMPKGAASDQRLLLLPSPVAKSDGDSVRRATIGVVAIWTLQFQRGGNSCPHRRTGFQWSLRIFCNILKLGMLRYALAAVPHPDGKRLARRPNGGLV